jgi:hypothetical protein
MSVRKPAVHLASSLFVLAMAVACTAASSPAPTASPSPTLGVTPSPLPSPSPAPSGSGQVDSEAEAAARVLRSDPRFTGIGPLLPDLIGQSAWYEAVAGADGYDVTITMGWGDCMAGCIDRHTWLFRVMADGTVTLVSEEGTDLPGDLPPPPDVTGDGSIDILLVAGPTCPVETQPPDPGCDPRAVANATVIISDADGNEVARTVSDDEGHARATLPAGVYVVQAEPVEGYMGTPPAAAVWALESGTGTVTLGYDTGIR